MLSQLRYLLLLGLILVHAVAEAQSSDAFAIKEIKQEYRGIESQVSVWTDVGGKASIEEARELFHRGIADEDSLEGMPIEQFVKIKALKNQRLPFGHVHWGHVAIENELERDIDLHLAVFSEYGDVYLVRENGEVEHYPSGRFRSATEMKEPKHRQGIPFLLKEDEKIDCFYRVESITHYPNFMIPAVRQELYIAERISSHQGYQGFFQGILWIMLLYNLLTYFSSKDRSYLYYVGYLFCGSLYFTYLYGWLTMYVTYNEPLLDSYLWMLSVYGSTLFYAYFTRAYFQTKEVVPHADRAIVWWIRLEWLLLALVMGVIAWNHNIVLVRSINMGVTLIGTIFSLWVVWQLRVIRTRIYYLFLVGALTYLLSVVVFFYSLMLANWGWISPISGLFMSYLVEGGLVTEILCFSIGLSYRMQQSEEQKREAQIALIAQLEANQKYQEEANQELEMKVEKRTSEIAHQNEEIASQKESLQQQKELLELQFLELRELNEEKNHLMGVLAHDLRNPLTSLLTVANLLDSEREELNEDQTEYVDLILRSLNRMKDLISRTLEDRKSEAKRESLKLEPTNMCAIVQEVLVEFDSKAKSKQIKLSCNDLSSSQTWARLDPQYFHQIAENLISNALKYSPIGKEVKVEVKAANGKALFSVKDCGPGIKEEDLPKMFQKYQRLSAQPTAGESSTGLGLSIVKKYTEAMKGEVWCENNLKDGCTFSVAFALAEAVAEER